MYDLFVSNPSINDGVRFDTIRSPTLIINAIDDPATFVEGARTLANKIKSSELLLFNSGGHLILGHEKEVKNQIRKFVSMYSARGSVKV